MRFNPWLFAPGRRGQLGHFTPVAGRPEAKGEAMLCFCCFCPPRSASSAQCRGKTRTKHKRPPTSDRVSGAKHFLKFGKESLLVLLSLRPIPACVSASRGPATWTQTAKGCSQTHLPPAASTPEQSERVISDWKWSRQLVLPASPCTASHSPGPLAGKAPESPYPRNRKEDREPR